MKVVLKKETQLAKAKENPYDLGGMGAGWLGKTFAIGGAAGLTFLGLEYVAQYRLGEVTTANAGKTDVEIATAQKTELYFEAGLELLGAIVVGYLAHRYVRSPIGQYVVYGISAGLLTATLNNVYQSTQIGTTVLVSP